MAQYGSTVGGVDNNNTMICWMAIFINSATDLKYDDIIIKSDLPAAGSILHRRIQLFSKGGVHFHTKFGAHPLSKRSATGVERTENFCSVEEA